MVSKSQTSQTVRYRTPDAVIPGGGITPGTEYLTPLPQTTQTEGHPWHRLNDGYKGQDIGGAFSTRKYMWKPAFNDRLFTLNAYYGGGVYYRNGTISMWPQWADFRNAVNYASDMTMDSWGTSAISSVIPTKSEVDLVVSAVELAREGLPAMIGKGLLKSKLKDFRKYGDELLNYEFGIKPLLGDLQGVAKSIVIAEKRIKQLERDSGKLVRRKFTFPVREETLIRNEYGASAVPNGWSNTYLWGDYNANHRQTITTYTSKRWFSGAFTYHLNLDARHRDALVAAADNARLLLGVKLDAETVWNLAPWTWLADWFGNVGDIMTNLSHFSRDGLVMPYGYMMNEQSSIAESTSRLYWRDPAGPQKFTDTYGQVSKNRRPATPFGFGLSDMVLDSRQTSILAALGITRVPRK